MCDAVIENTKLNSNLFSIEMMFFSPTLILPAEMRKLAKLHKSFERRRFFPSLFICNNVLRLTLIYMPFMNMDKYLSVAIVMLQRML